MKSIKKYSKIYFVALKNNIACQMAYRGDFAFMVIMTLFVESLIPFFTFFLYSQGVSFPDWNMHEVLVLQGVFILSGGVASILFFGIVGSTLSAVKEGTFDLLMIKPVSVLFLSAANNFEINAVGSVITGIVTIIIGLINMPSVMLGFSSWLFFFLFFILSLVILFSFAVIMAASVFKWVGNGRVYEIFESVSFFGKYPVPIYAKALRTIVTYVIPVSMIAFYPASALLGKPVENIGIVIIICFVFLFLSIRFYKFMLSRYTSAGG